MPENATAVRTAMSAQFMRRSQIVRTIGSVLLPRWETPWRIPWESGGFVLPASPASKLKDDVLCAVPENGAA